MVRMGVGKVAQAAGTACVRACDWRGHVVWWKDQHVEQQGLQRQKKAALYLVKDVGSVSSQMSCKTAPFLPCENSPGGRIGPKLEGAAGTWRAWLKSSMCGNGDDSVTSSAV